MTNAVLTVVSKYKQARHEIVTFLKGWVRLEAFWHSFCSVPFAGFRPEEPKHMITRNLIKTSQKKLHLVGACAVGIFTAAVSQAGEATPSKEVVPPAPVPPPVTSAITGDAGVTFVSKYFSRGIVQEDQGVIAQPYADLYFRLYEGDGFINKVTLNIGLWSSIHSHKLPTVDGGSSTSEAWYEFDYTGGFSVTFAKYLTATLSYFEFISPADNFNTARSINMNLAFDDSSFLGAFALHPHFTVLGELNAPGFAGLDSGGWYYEIGIAPGFAAGPVTFSFPLTVGLGDDNFYAGETYGYFSGGVSAAVPLAFIPESYGSWTVSASALYYNLGDSTALVNHGESDDFVFGGTLGVTF
ncbi:MAG TPA: hypothetical protein VIT91_11120 [Chthoniobacterales bacterium]